jgi:membrane-associated HD superfamily phosphohydrolase
MKKFTIEIKWAMISLIIFLAWMTLEKKLGYHDNNIKWQPVFNLLYVFPTSILYLLALLEKKKKYYQDQMSWKQGIISAIIISFIIVFFSPVTQFIIHEFISPNFLENTINHTVISKKLTLAEAKEYTTLTSSIWKNISDGLSFGVVIGAIVAYLIQSKKIDTSKSN